ncbi:MAG: TIGR00341 family protein [Nocardioides sp.]
MLSQLRARVLPEHKRRTLEELTEDLDLHSGDSAAKLSAFWTMLTLSAIIACAGVLVDSTATVIGAMIIAPLSTPIMGMALSVVKRQPNRSWLLVLQGVVLVVVIGIIGSLAVPSGTDLLANGQIAGRTSPNLLDLIAAIATGFAGAIALSRSDVGAVLPGVAIAISLVPPLAVVGVCLGQAAWSLAIGASLLFLSNLLALVIAGVLTYTVLGYTMEALNARPFARRRPYAVLTLMLVLVAIPLAGQSLGTYLVSRWTSEVRTTTTSWLGGGGAEVSDVEIDGRTVHIKVRHTQPLPDTQTLMTDLSAVLPHGLTVVLDSTVGAEQNLGQVG